MHRDHLGQRARICQLEVACSYRLRLRRLDRGVQFSHLKSIAKRENRGEREIRKWQKRSRRQRRTTTPAVSGLAPGPVAYVSYSFNFAVSFPSALVLLDLPFTRATVAPGRAESAISPLTLLRFGFNEPEIIPSYPTLNPAAEPSCLLATPPDSTSTNSRPRPRPSRPTLEETPGFASMPLSVFLSAIETSLLTASRFYSEAWRYTGPFSRMNRFRGLFPGFGVASVAFAGYCAYEHVFLKDDHHGDGHH